MGSRNTILETLLLTCVEPSPIQFSGRDEEDCPRVVAAIKRISTPKGARFQRPVNRKPFLLGCLQFTASLPEEHLIVGYGYRHGNTTSIERVHRVAGAERSVHIPAYIRDEIRRHHYSTTDAEVVVFHNHPRIGYERETLYFIKALLDDLPIPSSEDRHVLQQHAFNPVAMLRQLMDQGRVLFYLGESGYVKQFNLPNLLAHLRHLKLPQQYAV